MTDALVILAKARSQCIGHCAPALDPRFREDDDDKPPRFLALTALSA